MVKETPFFFLKKERALSEEKSNPLSRDIWQLGVTQGEGGPVAGPAQTTEGNEKISTSPGIAAARRRVPAN